MKQTCRGWRSTPETHTERWQASGTDINSLVASVRRRNRIDGSTHRFSMIAEPAAALLCQMDDEWTASGCPNYVFWVVRAMGFCIVRPSVCHTHARTRRRTHINIPCTEVKSPLLRLIFFLSVIVCIALSWLYSVSQKIPRDDLYQFFQNGWEFLQPNFTHLLRVPIYARLQIFIQLSATLTKLCHIKCDHPACVSVDGRHFEHIMVVALIMA